MRQTDRQEGRQTASPPCNMRLLTASSWLRLGNTQRGISPQGHCAPQHIHGNYPGAHITSIPHKIVLGLPTRYACSGLLRTRTHVKVILRENSRPNPHDSCEKKETVIGRQIILALKRPGPDCKVPPTPTTSVTTFPSPKIPDLLSCHIPETCHLTQLRKIYIFFSPSQRFIFLNIVLTTETFLSLV